MFINKYVPPIYYLWMVQRSIKHRLVYLNLRNYDCRNSPQSLGTQLAGAMYGSGHVALMSSLLITLICCNH